MNLMYICTSLTFYKMMISCSVQTMDDSDQAPDVVIRDMDGNRNEDPSVNRDFSRHNPGLTIIIQEESNNRGRSINNRTRRTCKCFLNLSSRNISSLDNYIKDFGIYGLNVMSNVIEELPRKLGELTRLTEIYINNNRLNTIIPEIGNLKNLVIFEANDNNINQLPDTFCNLKKLKVLNFANNKFTNLPEVVTKLCNLEKLKFANNLINVLEPNVCDMSELRFLDMCSNELVALPHDIGKLVKLRVLNVSHNKITMLPRSCGRLQSLLFLRLCGNLLTDLPDELFACSNLHACFANSNKISVLPDLFYKLKHLQFLNLDNNGISVVPNSIRLLTRLQVFGLKNNKIAILPDIFSDLVQLRYLNFSGNLLSTLPKSIEKLENLRVLELCNNRLTSFPIDVTNLSNIKIIHLYNNKIECMDANTINELSKSSTLKLLDLRQNPLLEKGALNVCGSVELIQKLGNRVMLDNYFRLYTRLMQSMEFPKKIQALHDYANGPYNSYRQKQNLLNIDRSNVLEDTKKQLMQLTKDDIKTKKTRITFTEEPGSDMGGITREWLGLVSKEFVISKYFSYVDNNSKITAQPSYIRDITAEQISYYECFGRIMAIAIIEKSTLNVRLDTALYNHLLGKPCTISDFQVIDPTFYKSLLVLIKNSVNGMSLFFAVTEKCNDGTTTEVELIPNGGSIQVTDENKRQYVYELIRYKSYTRIAKQLAAIRTGLCEIIDIGLLATFNQTELNLLISGTYRINIHEWRMRTKYKGYVENDEVINWFWILVKTYTEKQRSNLLHFATGMYQTPCDEVLNFVIVKTNNVDSMPVAHTCSCELELPAYETYEKLSRFLTYVIEHHAQGFGLA